MKNKNGNPFVLDFGREPYEMIPRSRVMNELAESFMADRPSRQVAIITGVRGSGKTVFMTSVCKLFQQEEDWIVVELNPARDLLQGLAAKLSEEKSLRDVFTSAKINLSAFGLGFEVAGAPPIQDIEVALSRMLSGVRAKNKKVLVAVDEASNTPQMRVFASAFQILLRQDLPVFLLMTGLYENIASLQDEKSLTFLYRAPRIALSPLNIGRMTDSYARVFSIPQELALKMAQKTKGYSFAFQVLGYFTWEYRDDPARIDAEYKQYLEEYVYEKIWQELSPGDRKVLYGIANVPSGEVSEIRDFLQMTSNQFTPYRSRLIRKGIINGEAYGVVRFELPLFEAFVLENYYPGEQFPN